MNQKNVLKFSFLRTEKDNKYRLFLEIDSGLLEQDVEINLTDDKKLEMKLENGEKLITGELPLDLYDSLANRKTSVFFLDKNATIIANDVLEPLLPKKKNKP